MRCNRSIVLYCLSITLGLSLASCANIQIQRTLLIPANSADFQAATNLMIMEFSGDKDHYFADKLSNYLISIKIDNEPFFNRVVLADLAEEKQAASTSEPVSSDAVTTAPTDKQSDETTSIDAPAPESVAHKDGDNKGKDMSLVAASEPSTIKPQSERERHIIMAKTAGADILILGSLIGPETTEIHFTELRTACEGSSEKCKDIAKLEVACTRQLAKLLFTMKALNVLKGSVVLNEKYRGVAENNYCDDKLSDKKELSLLSGVAMDNAIEKIRDDVAPSIVNVTLEFMANDDSDLSSNNDAKMLLDLGLQYAKENNMDLACKQFRMANLGYGESPALFHNLGLCAEINNDLDEAIGLYTQADRLSEVPHEPIRAALQRVNKQIAKRH